MFTDCHGEADIAFILDSSGSVGHENFAKMRNFVHDIIKYLKIGESRYQAALIVYSELAWTEYNLTTYRTQEDILYATMRARYIYGSTNTADAIRLMRNGVFAPGNGNREGIQNLAVLITDGISNVNTRATIAEARIAKNAGITIAGIGVALESRRELEELQDIVTEPASRFAVQVTDFEDLEELTEQFVYALCSGT